MHAYMRHWTGSWLVRIMACRLFDTKLLSKLMMNSHQLHPKEQSSMKKFSKLKFIVRNFAAILSRGRQINPLVTIIWELWCRKQVSQAGISNCIPQYSVGCNYLSLSEIPASAIRHGWPCSTLFQVMADCWCKPSPEQGGGSKTLMSS